MKKKKDNGLKAVICLAVATVVVGGASIALSNMDNGAGKGVVLDITGANTKIKEAAKAVMVEQKLDAVMDQRGVFVGGLDITDMVINKLKGAK